ncbi:MAG: 30S ribosomal protein S17 [Endomicrobiales bacterium]|jgi:small subunit ribosomal protein S17
MERAQRKFRAGTVVTDKVNKTRIVVVDRTYRDSVYSKVLRTKTKFYVHDEKNESKIGDTVRIMETRPLSKMKRWALIEVVKKAQG